MSKARTGLIAGGSALIALVVGIVGGASAASTTAAPKPTPTVTATATVPGPTVTETEAPEPVVQETTPQSCLDAIKDAEAGFAQVAKFVGVVQPFPDMIVRAAQAGMDTDPEALHAVREDLDSANEEMSGISSKVSAIGDEFNQHKGACRASADSN